MSTATERPIFVLAERLVQIWLRNQAHLAELETLRTREERAGVYMQARGSQSQFVRSYLARLEDARREHLINLRWGRREAMALIARADEQLAFAGASQCPGEREQSARSISAFPTHRTRTRKYA